MKRIKKRRVVWHRTGKKRRVTWHRTGRQLMHRGRVVVRLRHWDCLFTWEGYVHKWARGPRTRG